MNRYVNAKEGYKFVPSDKGRQDGRIASKFELDYPQCQQYFRQVPERWIREGLVEEIKI